MKVTETTWRGLPAMALHGGGRTAILGLVGAQLASLRLDGDNIEPMWQPSWPSADPIGLDARALEAYGSGPDAPLLAAACGSFPCCDRFGPPPPGMEGTTHGTAAIARYTVVRANADGIELCALLDPTGLEIRRHFTFFGDYLEVSTTVRHQDTVIRELDWCEHTTLGGILLDDANISATIDQVVTPPDIAAMDSKTALAMPLPDAPPWGGVVAGTVVGGRWRVESRRCRRRLTCSFNATDWPWLTVWTEHHSRTSPPWRGRERARGMELSNRPFPEPYDPSKTFCSSNIQPTLTQIPPGDGTTKILKFCWESC